MSDLLVQNVSLILFSAFSKPLFEIKEVLGQCFVPLGQI
jgi:hypothetical protein